MSQPGFSDIECKIIMAQIERRAKYRQEFLKLRTDPCKHSQQAGFVFDPAIQRFVSMKTFQYDHFRPNSRTLGTAFMALTPMFLYGYLIWNQRHQFEMDCRCGRISYRDRRNKLV